MKKIIYLLSIAFLMLQSCSSGDGSGSSNNNSLLLKKWYWVSQTRVGQQPYYLTPCSNGNNDYFEFISPNVANFHHVRSNNDCSFVLEHYTWTKNGNELILTFSGIPYIATISELTASRLVYTLDEGNGTSSVYVFSSN